MENKLELTIKAARFTETRMIEFLFEEKDNESLKQVAKQKYDLCVSGDAFATITMKNGIAHHLLKIGIEYLEGLKTEWELKGDIYELIKIWNPKGDKRSSDETEFHRMELPEDMPRHIKKLLKKALVAYVVGDDPRGLGKPKPAGYEYDQLDGEHIITIGELNERGKKGWGAIDVVRDGIKIKSVLMMRKIQ